MANELDIIIFEAVDHAAEHGFTVSQTKQHITQEVMAFMATLEGDGLDVDPTEKKDKNPEADKNPEVDNHPIHDRTYYLEKALILGGSGSMVISNAKLISEYIEGGGTNQSSTAGSHS